MKQLPQPQINNFLSENRHESISYSSGRAFSVFPQPAKSPPNKLVLVLFHLFHEVIKVPEVSDQRN